MTITSGDIDRDGDPDIAIGGGYPGGGDGAGLAILLNERLPKK